MALHLQRFENDCWTEDCVRDFECYLRSSLRDQLGSTKRIDVSKDTDDCILDLGQSAPFRDRQPVTASSN